MQLLSELVSTLISFRGGKQPRNDSFPKILYLNYLSNDKMYIEVDVGLSCKPTNFGISHTVGVTVIRSDLLDGEWRQQRPLLSREASAR